VGYVHFDSLRVGGIASRFMQMIARIAEILYSWFVFVKGDRLMRRRSLKRLINKIVSELLVI